MSYLKDSDGFTGHTGDKNPITKPICQNCRFWKQNEVIRDFGNCKSPKLVVIDSISKDQTRDTFASPYRFLQTGKDFGCIHFEKKD